MYQLQVNLHLHSSTKLRTLKCFTKLSLASRQLGKRDDGGGEKDVESE